MFSDELQWVCDERVWASLFELVCVDLKRVCENIASCEGTLHKSPAGSIVSAYWMKLQRICDLLHPEYTSKRSCRVSSHKLESVLVEAESKEKNKKPQAELYFFFCLLLPSLMNLFCRKKTKSKIRYKIQNEDPVLRDHKPHALIVVHKTRRWGKITLICPSWRRQCCLVDWASTEQPRHFTRRKIHQLFTGNPVLLPSPN